MPTTIHLSGTIQDRVDRHIARTGIPLNELIAIALDQYLTRAEPTAATEAAPHYPSFEEIADEWQDEQWGKREEAGKG
jgi:hypothetical protein